MKPNSNRVGVYLKTTKYRSNSTPDAGYPYCSFCVEKYKIKDELRKKSMALAAKSRDQDAVAVENIISKTDNFSPKRLSNTGRQLAQSFHTQCAGLASCAAKVKAGAAMRGHDVASCYDKKGMPKGCGRAVETKVSTLYANPLTKEEVMTKLDLLQRLLIEGNLAYMKRQIGRAHV